MKELEFNQSRQELASQAAALLADVAKEYQPITLANSLGAEDMVLMDLVCKNQLDISIFILDTGRLHEETYDLLARAQAHYGKAIDVYFPEAEPVEQYVKLHGINGFRESIDNRKGCCGIRKIQPLKRALSNVEAWITGLRREQSTTRAEVATLEWDEAFGIQKINPLVDWSEDDVWAYIQANDVPYNVLHDQHFPSIGCAPCTRAIAAGEDVRAGRWWWENPEFKECGLHPAGAAK